MSSLQKTLCAGTGHSQVFNGDSLEISAELRTPAIAGIVVGSIVKCGGRRIANDPERWRRIGNSGVIYSISGIIRGREGREGKKCQSGGTEDEKLFHNMMYFHANQTPILFVYR